MKEFIGRGGEPSGPRNAGVSRHFLGFRSAGVKLYGLENTELMEFLLWLAERRGYRTDDTRLLHLLPRPRQAFCVR